MSISRQFAIVTGASTGIGLELAKCCAREGFDVLIAADEPQIESAATEIRALGAIVETVQADLSTTEGLDKLYEASKRSAVRSMHYSLMPAGASDMRSSIMISTMPGLCFIPRSRDHCMSFARSETTCGSAMPGES